MKQIPKWRATCLANRKTKEIHRLQNLHPLCHINPSDTKTYKYCSPFVAWFLMTFCGYDGCGHCWPGKSKRNYR